MYDYKPSFVYGFHGTDKDTALKILNHTEDFEPSKNEYDWLGSGVYFWEHDPHRAMDFAIKQSKIQDSKIKEPYVIGAAIDLGNCLDLLTQKGIRYVKTAHAVLKHSHSQVGIPMPENIMAGDKDFDYKKRYLDRAVIEIAHQLAEKSEDKFHTVRSAFFENSELYDGAMFRSGNHIQISVRDLSCIKGVFLPKGINNI